MHAARLLPLSTARTRLKAVAYISHSPRETPTFSRTWLPRLIVGEQIWVQVSITTNINGPCVDIGILCLPVCKRRSPKFEWHSVIIECIVLDVPFSDVSRKIFESFPFHMNGLSYWYLLVLCWLWCLNNVRFWCFMKFSYRRAITEKKS